ncbi:MAG: F0F1 ATP synthase subunit B' [Rhodobacterales bacterium]|jgi:F-type H+-transporting ATPase subunit b|nr:F0F1 ATP synthase subunit B' [Rhodobacterales bacterium]
MADKVEGAAQAAESAPGMPQLDFSTFPNQIFWLVVTLIVLYLVLSRVALPRIATVLSERHGAIQRDLDKAEEMKRSAIEAENTYNQALADARVKANDIVNEAKAEIQKDLDKAIAKADLEIAAKAAESEKAISAIKDSAVQSVEEVANITANNIVDAILPEAADTKKIKVAVATRLKG